MKTKNSNFHQLKVTSYNCFFSEVCQVSHAMLQHKKDLTSNRLNNCFATFENNQILIISQGGNRYQLPMDQQVLRILPLSQGILIQFAFKQQPKLSEILYYQKSKTMMEIQQLVEGKYCYATINRHPLNPLKVLGEIRNQQIIPWLKVMEKVTCVSNCLPIILSYNIGLNRNAFHIMLANIKQVKKQYQYAFISTHTYSLKNVGDSAHSQLLTQAIFQESHQSEEIIQMEVNKSNRSGCIILYARTHSQIKVFQLNLYAMTNSTRLLTIIKFPLAIKSVSLYPPQMFFPTPFNRYKKGLLIDIVEATIQTLPDSVAVINKHSTSYYYGGETINSINLSQQLKMADNKLLDILSNKIPSSLIDDNFDALVIRVLQTALEDEPTFLTLIRKYCCGQPLLSTLVSGYKKAPKILAILHYVYEEVKLYELMGEERKRIGYLVMQIALQQNLSEYIDYYLRQGYHINKQVGRLPIKSEQEVYDMFCNFTRILCQIIPRNTPLVLFSRTQFLYNFLQLLVFGQVQQHSESFSRDFTRSKYQHGKQYFYRNRYPLLSQKVFHLDYYDSIYEDSSFKQVQTGTKQQQAFLYLVNHNHNHHDILSYPLSIRAIFYCILREMRLQLPYSLYDMIPKLGFYLIHREDLYKNIRLYKRVVKKIPHHLANPSFDEHIKTLVHTSTSHEYFLTSNASEMNKINNDLAFEQVNRLLSTSSEIHIKAKDIESIPEDRWEIESQNILLKFANRRLAVLIGQGSFTLGTSRSFITDIIKIPKINLSAIMPNDIKITLDLKQDKQSLVYWPQFHSGMAAGLRLSRHVIPLSQDHLKTWIFYQKPDTPKRDHSGFLLSLGLLGYLRCFSPTDIYQYLKPNNQFTSVAILLGVSASNISRSQQAISKTLILHIPVLLPPTVDVEIPINVQTSALIGLGLLHKGTCNRSMAEMTLSQIGKKPSTDKCLDRQGYSLAAGWALGMICLGVGDKKESFRDLHLEERLIRFIQGGKKMQPPQSMMSANYMNQNKCSSIKEGPNVNLHITAPAALLAISLMYLKSNNADLADKISIPNSFNTIEECNPNHILLKTLAKNLIMWDSIGNTKQFIHEQVPQLIRFIYENPLSKVYERYYLVYNVSEIDYQTISTIYASVMTGGILAMALKFAGTGNRAAMQTIKYHIQQLKTIKIIKCQFANDPMNKNCIDQYQLFSLLSTSLLGLSIVMAGTCDIECLKIIRVVRKKFQDSKVFHYGFSMAVNMSIGFIFLGYGNYTFNRQDMSIAALLISIFPQYPNSPTDNKWHLQPLRHFYVLAMEQKIFHAVDVDTNKVVNVSTEMQFLVDGQVVTESLHTPILLQQSKKLLRVKIKDEDYFDVDFAFDINKPDPKAIYIKRKHFKDINQQIINPQNPLSTEIARNNIQKCLQQQHRYTSLIGFDKQNSKLSYLLPKSKNIQNIKIMPNNNEFPHQIYYKLLKEDKMEMLQIYLALKQQLKNSKHIDCILINNLNLLLTFQKIQGIEILRDMVGQIISIYQKDVLSRTDFKGYLLDPYSKKKTQSSGVTFHQMLKLVNIPSSKNIFIIRDAINKLKSKAQSFSIIEMLLYTSFPQCSMILLHKLIESYYNG